MQTQSSTLIYAIHEASSPGRGHKKQAPTSYSTAKNEWLIKGEELKVNLNPFYLVGTYEVARIVRSKFENMAVSAHSEENRLPKKKFNSYLLYLNYE